MLEESHSLRSNNTPKMMLTVIQPKYFGADILSIGEIPDF
jgi:hypothetical protein